MRCTTPPFRAAVRLNSGVSPASHYGLESHMKPTWNYLARCFSVLIYLSLVGCATAPTYTFQPYPVGQNQTDINQAQAICSPRAQLAAQQTNLAATTAGNSGQQICLPGQFNYYGCQVQNSTGALATTLNAQGSAQSAGDAAYMSCMAEYGWNMVKQCVSGC